MHTHAVEDLLNRALAEQAPVIMLGDFNMTDRFHVYRLITQHFTDAYRGVGASGFGFSYPHGKRAWLPPLVRLDYLFYSPAFTGLSSELWPQSGSSDHRPLLTRLALMGSQHAYRTITPPHPTSATHWLAAVGGGLR